MRAARPQPKVEDSMNKVCKFAVVLGMGLVLAPCAAIAQATADQPAAAATVAAPTVPPDQQPTKEQLAKLFEVMRLRQQMEGVMKMMPTMVQQQVQAQVKDMTSKLSGGAPTPEQQAAIQKVLDKFMQKAFSLYPINEMLDDMSGLYQRHLTGSDVDAFIAFYASPAGQHLLDAQPAIMQEYMPLVMSRMQVRSKALNDELIKEMSEIVKSQPPAADKPSAK
jgi:hypothetical protein